MTLSCHFQLHLGTAALAFRSHAQGSEGLPSIP